MRRAGLAVVTVLLGASAASAEVMVRVSGDQVAIRATATPLADVLDRLARQTGMAVVYEGPPPRQPVTIAFDGRSPAEAVLGLLEGQGLNYALVADSTGRRVATLVLSGPAGSATLTARTPGPSPALGHRPFSAIPRAGPDAADSTFAAADEEPFDDAPLAPDEPPEDAPEAGTAADAAAAQAVPPAPRGSSPTDLQAPPGAPVEAQPTPAPGRVFAPGSQGQAFSASPFTPQPPASLPFPLAPPGTPGATATQGDGAARKTSSPP
jgi:hypothetical protein